MAEFEEETPATESEPLRGPPQACIFVASIATMTTEDRLQEHFSNFGRVLKTKLLKDKALRPYAFVQFLDPQSAEQCLVTEDQQLDGRRLRVERAKVNRTLFLAKFSLTLTPPELRKIAETFGSVESVTIIKHHPSNKSKGCGFVKYHYREDATEAFSGLKSRFKKWVVEWATSANDPELLGVTKNVVYVGGLPSNTITETILKNHFSTYGTVEDVSIVHPTLSMIKAQQQSISQQQSPISSPTSAVSSASQTPSSTHGSLTDRSNSPSAQLLGSSTASDTVTPTTVPVAGKEAASDTPLPTAAGDPSFTPIKPLTSYAFITFAEVSAASAAIENENGASFQGEIIRVQYCETADMKMRKKMSKMRDSYHTNQADAQAYPPNAIYPPQNSAVPYPYYSPHPAVVNPPVLPGSAVPYWVSQPSSGTSSTSDTPGWYYVPPLQITIPPKDLSSSDSSISDARPSPISIPMGFPAFLQSPTYAPLGFPSSQLSPLASPIPLQPYFPIQIPTPTPSSSEPSPLTSPHP